MALSTYNSGSVSDLQSAAIRFTGLDRAGWGGITVWLPVGLGLGIAIYFNSPSEPDWHLALLVVVAGSVIGLAGAAFARTWPPLIPIGLLVFAVSAGFAVASFRTSAVSAPVLERPLIGVFLEGTVLSIERRPESARLIVEVTRLAWLDPSERPERVRIVSKRLPAEIRPGDRLRATVGLRPPPAPAMPGAYDFQRRAFFEKIGAVGFTMGAISSEAVKDRGLDIPLALERARDQASTIIRATLSSPAGPLAAALLTGDRSGIGESDLAALRDSGLAHLLAISGLHLGLVAGIVFFLSRALLAAIESIALAYPIKKCAALIALAAAFAYLLLTGWSAPTLRAFIMTGLVLLAVILDRRAISMRLVGLAAGLILLTTPEALMGASFQLSFAAVTALVAVYETRHPERPMVDGNRPLLGKVGLWLFYLSLTTIIATLATAPLAAIHFNRVAVYGLLANLLAVPIATFWVMPMGLAALLMLPLGLHAWPLDLMAAGINAIMGIAHSVADLPGAVISLPTPHGVTLPLLAAAGVVAALCRGWPSRLGLILAVSTLPISLLLTTPPDLIIGPDARYAAVRHLDKLILLDGSGGRFLAESWSRRTGMPVQPVDADTEPSVRCDDIGCIVRRNGHILAISRHRQGLVEDCRRADLLIDMDPHASRRAARPCPPLIWTARSWPRQGSAVVWLQTPHQPKIITDRDSRGNRPWTNRH